MQRDECIAVIISYQSLLKISRQPSEKILRLLQVHFELDQCSFLTETDAGIVLNLEKIPKDDVISAIYNVIAEYAQSLNHGGRSGGV